MDAIVCELILAWLEVDGVADGGASVAETPLGVVRPRRGRPRDPGMDTAILTATMSLLSEIGYARLSMEQVAARAVVSKASLYLRWPNKVALVCDAVRRSASALPAVPDTGSLSGDSRVFLRALLDPRSNASRALLAAAGEIATHPAIRAAWQQGPAATIETCVRTIVSRAAARGEMPPDTDVELLAQVLFTLAQNMRLDHDHDPDDAAIERVVHQFLDRSPARRADDVAAPAGLVPGTTSPGRRRGRRRGELTVATVARLAGVSTPTVSKVLNGRSGVAPETRRRVEALLREHEYRRPEMVIRADTVEVAFYGMQSSMAVEIMHGVERVASENRLAVAFTDVRRQLSAGRFWAEDLLARRPTGVISVHLGFTTEQHALLAASAIPLVALDPMNHPGYTVPSVGAANWSGGVDAARHLLDLGHRRIAVIAGPAERLCARARLEGVRAALDAAGMPLDERLVRIGKWFSYDDGLAHGRELLRLPDPPTAVVCGNDLQALGVYEAARQVGQRIPQELSVVGFDDISFARWCGPPMTTVRQPFEEMGATAARQVLALAAGEPLAQTRTELSTSLIVRDSTAPPRNFSL